MHTEVLEPSNGHAWMPIGHFQLEEGGGKNDLGSQCTMVGSPVDQGVSIRLDTGRKKGIKKTLQKS